MKIKMHWNPWLERWILRDMLGANMGELADCPRFRIKYPGMSKDDVNVVEDSPGVVVAKYQRYKDGLPELPV